jgi:hypothetical protein
MVKSGEVIVIKLVLFEEEEDVVEEMGEKDKGNQHRESESLFPMCPFQMRKRSSAWLWRRRNMSFLVNT